jgi:hypothetical protein
LEIKVKNKKLTVEPQSCSRRLDGLVTIPFPSKLNGGSKSFSPPDNEDRKNDLCRVGFYLNFHNE